MRPTNVAHSGMPSGKTYMGWWGDIGGPKQKGMIRYSLSPFQQSPLKGAFQGYIFNGFQRIAGHFPYFIFPVVVGYATYSWATKHYEFLNSKAGHVAAHAAGGEEHH